LPGRALLERGSSKALVSQKPGLGVNLRIDGDQAMKPGKIILVYPNPVFPGNHIWHCTLSSLSLSIMSLVPFLEKNGFAARIIDTRDADYGRVQYHNALFVGISTQTGVQIKNGLEVA